MFDDIGLGKFLANSIITMGMLFLLIMNVILIYFKEKIAKWILISIILNIISAVYFGGYASNLIVNLNLIYWPLANLLFIIWLSVKNIVLYKKNKEEYKTEHKQSNTKKVIFRLLLIILTLWFFAVTGYFFYAVVGFFHILI